MRSPLYGTLLVKRFIRQGPILDLRVGQCPGLIIKSEFSIMLELERDFKEGCGMILISQRQLKPKIITTNSLIGIYLG